MQEPREALWDRIAIDFAGGETISALAHRYGYSYGGMKALVDSEKMKARVGIVQDQIANAQKLARTRMALAQPELVEGELEAALGRVPVLDKDGNPSLDSEGNPITEWASPPGVRMAARHYLLDKLMPTVNVNVGLEKKEVHHQTVIEIRDALQSLKAIAPQLPGDIRNSRYVLEGEAAIPRALAGVET